MAITKSGITEIVGGGGGTLPDGDYGDIAVSGAGTVMTIDSGVVTYAKIQDVSATDLILGRVTAGAGDVEEITCTAAGRAILDDASASAQRTTLGLGTIATQGAGAVAITGGTITGITDLAVADGGTGSSTAGGARTNLGLVIGTDVQAQNANLSAFAGLSGVADRLAYFTGASALALATFTAQARTWVAATTSAAQTALLDIFTSGAKGLVPASGGGTTNFLRADGTFAVPPGTGGTLAAPLYRSDLAALTDNTLMPITVGWDASHPKVTGYWLWQAGASWTGDTTAVTATGVGSGFWVQFFPTGFLSPTHGGAMGDYNTSTRVLTTDDHAAVLWALNASVQFGVPASIDRNYGVVFGTAALAIRWPSGAELINAGGSISSNSTNHIPWFWTNGDTAIRSGKPGDHVVFGFGGTNDSAHRADSALHAGNAEFNAFYTTPFMNHPAAADATNLKAQYGAFSPIHLIVGGSDVKMYHKYVAWRPSTGTDTEIIESYIQHCIGFHEDAAGVKPVDCHFGGVFDGVFFTVFSTGVGAVKMEYADIFRHCRYPDTGGAGDFPASHSIGYFSTGANSVGGFGEFVDSNYIEVTNCRVFGPGDPWPVEDALAPLKPRAANMLFRASNIYNSGPWAIFQGAVRWLEMSNIIDENIGTGLATYSQPWLIQSNDATNNPITMGGCVENYSLYMTENASSSIFSTAAGATLDNFHLRNWRASFADATLTSVGLFQFNEDVRNSTFECTITSRTAETGSVPMITFATGTVCDNSNFTFTLFGYGAATPRFICSDQGSGSESWAKFILADSATNKVITIYTSGMRITEETVRTTVTPASGTGAHVVLAVPDGAILVEVSAIVTTALGTANGLTSVDVGTAADPNQYGTLTALTAGGVAGSVQWTASPSLLMTAATNLQLTPNGGTGFDGTGVVRVTTKYRVIDNTTDND